MKGFSGFVICCLCFCVGCGVLLSVFGGPNTQTQLAKPAEPTLQDAPVRPPADLRETLKQARGYAARHDEEGVLMELDDLSPEDLQRPEVQKLYKAATLQKGLKARKSYAEEYERQLLSNGMDATVRASGKDGDKLTITYVLTSRPLIYRLQNDADLNAQWKRLGFKSVWMGDGFDSSWSFKIE